MSWFSQKDWSSLAQSAKTALSTAQKTIDRALDIDEENKIAGDQWSVPQSVQPSSSKVDTDSFFESFLSPHSADNLSTTPTLRPPSPARSLNKEAAESSSSIPRQRLFSDGGHTGSAQSSGDAAKEIELSSSTQISDNTHRRVKSSGNVSTGSSQKSNGMSSASESIEVLSFLSSEKMGESYYQDFASPPKLNVLHKALKHGDGSSSSSGNNQHSPNSGSDYGVEESASPSEPGDSEIPLNEHEPSEEAPVAEQRNIHQNEQISVNVSSERLGSSNTEVTNSSQTVQSWLMVTDSTASTISTSSTVVSTSPTVSAFQPDLLPVNSDESIATLEPVAQDLYSFHGDHSENSGSSTLEIRAITPPDIQQMTSHYNPTPMSDSLQPLPDVQLNTSFNQSEDGETVVQIPDLTNSSRERPDIFPSEEVPGSPRQNQAVDLVVQELDVISAVDQSSARLNEELANNEELLRADERVDTAPNAIDVVVQELDVVQGMDLPSSNAMTSLDILPTNMEPDLTRGEDGSRYREEEVSANEIAMQQISILNELPAATMDRTGSANASMHSSSPENQLREGERTAIIDELLEKIQSLEETVHAREHQLISVNKRATDAQEENEELRSQLEMQFQRLDEETSRLNEAHQLELNTVTIKYNSSQQRLKELEKQMHDFKTASSFSAQLQASLSQKDAMIEEMRAEGEKLAQEEYKKNSLIKKLKAKEKELQTSLDKTKQNLDDKTSELTSVTESFTKLQQKVAEQRDTITQMNATMTRNESLLSKKTNENDELVEKTSALQNNLDSVFRELRELQQQMADKDAKFAQSQAVVNEEILQEKEELLRSLQCKWEEERELLSQQVQDANTSVARMEQAAARRENLLKDEIKDLQMRLEEEMQRGQGLSEGVSQATQPLWNQISRLQRQQQDQQSQWSQLEKNYLDRLAEAESRAGQAAESERIATESAVELKIKMSSLEAQLATVRSEHSKSVKINEQKDSDLERLREQVATLKEELVVSNEKSAMVERQLSVVQAEMDCEKQALEQVKRKCRTLDEQNREMVLRLKETENGYNGKYTSQQFSPISSTPPEKTPNALVKPNSSNTVGSNVNSRTLSSWEFLESQVKLKDGEASALQTELRRLEQQNVSLREDFVRLSNERHVWEGDKDTLERLRGDLEELQGRYETLLTMYGEKAEEVDELKMDLTDVKVIYKAQIEDLVKKLAQQKA